MATLVKSFAIQGIDGYRVDIEVTTLDGQPMLSIIGLGDLAVKEAGERIQAAMDSCGYDFPKKKVIINLAPGDKKKKGSHFDLAMAIVKEVRSVRAMTNICPSAQPDVNVPEMLNFLIENEVYKEDYENITARILGERCEL